VAPKWRLVRITIKAARELLGWSQKAAADLLLKGAPVATSIVATPASIVDISRKVIANFL
jgi:hypothetical protein